MHTNLEFIKFVDSITTEYWLSLDLVGDSVESLIQSVPLGLKEIIQKFPILSLPQFPSILAKLATQNKDFLKAKKLVEISNLLNEFQQKASLDFEDPFIHFCRLNLAQGLLAEKQGMPKSNVIVAISLLQNIRKYAPFDSPLFFDSIYIEIGAFEILATIENNTEYLQTSIEKLNYAKETLAKSLPKPFYYLAHILIKDAELLHTLSLKRSVSEEEIDYAISCFLIASQFIPYVALSPNIELIRIFLFLADLYRYKTKYHSSKASFISKAILYYKKARLFCNPSDYNYFVSLFNEGNAHLELADLNTNSAESYFSALKVFEEVEKLLIEQNNNNGEEYGNCLINLGLIKFRLVQQDNSQENLIEEAIDSCERGIEFLKERNLNRARSLNVFGMILAEKNKHSPSSNLSNQAIEKFVESEEIFINIAPQSPERGICIMNLGVELQFLASQNVSPVSNIERSIKYFKMAQDLFVPNSFHFAQCLCNEAISYKMLVDLSAVPIMDGLNYAIERLRLGQRTLQNLGSFGQDYFLCLYNEAQTRKKLADYKFNQQFNLQESIFLFSESRRFCSSNSIYYAMSLMDESNSHTQLSQLDEENSSKHLSQANLILSDAMSIIPKNSFNYATCLFNYADIKRLAGEPTPEVISTLKEALKISTSVENQGVTARAGGNLGILYYQMKDFISAREIAIKTMEFIEGIRTQSQTILDKKLALSELPRVMNVLIESTFQLENEGTLSQGEAIHFVEKFRASSFQELSLHFNKDTINQGSKQFLLADMLHLAKKINRTIVNLWVGECGTLVFILRPNGQFLQRLIAEITHQTIGDLMFGRDKLGSPIGWFTSYQEYKSGYIRRKDWKNQIEKTLEVLKNDLVRKICKDLHETETKLAIVTGDQLALMPIQAAFYVELNTTDEILKDLDIIYSPSISFLENSSTDIKTTNLNFVSIIGSNGNSSNKELTSMHIEANRICSFVSQFPNLQIAKSLESVNKLKVLQNIEESQITHLICHGIWNSDNPLSSVLELDNNEFFELNDLLNIDKFKTPKVVVLSACESGIGAEPFGSNEDYLGIPAWFLACGVKTVIGSLWMSDDIASALLMSQMYNYITSGKSLGESLYKSQYWLKEITANDILDLLEKEESYNIDAVKRAIIRGECQRGQKLFSHPYYWANWQIIGGGSDFYLNEV